LIRPYYEDSAVKIFHGRCEDILPELDPVDLVLTDPPYGIGRDGGRFSTSSHGGRKPYEFLGWDKKPPEDYLIKLLLNKGKDCVLWGANYYPSSLPPSMGWLVWDKGQDICPSDCELAFTTRKAALRRKVLNRVELLKDGTSHPTQKPLLLIKWCISFFPESKTILDPFMGSGTTLRAAKDLNRKAIGIEIEEKYCEIAAQRMCQEVLEL
jgi:DNA modification methylase